MKKFEFPLTVRYSDLGEDNRLSPVGALGLMQEAAGCADRASDLTIRGEAGEKIYVWVLCGWKFQFHRRPAWRENLRVSTWVRAMAARTCSRDFIITDEAGEKILSATSCWLLLNTRTGHAAKIADAVEGSYELCEERATADDLPVTAKGPADAPCTFTYTVMHRDIDTIHHVNNLRYLELAVEALPEELRSLPFDHYEILYKRQIKLGDTVHFFYSCTDGKHLVEIKDSEMKKTHAMLWFY